MKNSGTCSFYNILDFIEQINHKTHYFSAAIVDLHFHGDLWLDPALTPNKYTVTDFKKILQKTFEDSDKFKEG